jgi:hypothetical protein
MLDLWDESAGLYGKKCCTVRQKYWTLRQDCWIWKWDTGVALYISQKCWILYEPSALRFIREKRFGFEKSVGFYARRECLVLYETSMLDYMGWELASYKISVRFIWDKSIGFHPGHESRILCMRSGCNFIPEWRVRLFIQSLHLIFCRNGTPG